MTSCQSSKDYSPNGLGEVTGGAVSDWQPINRAAKRGQVILATWLHTWAAGRPQIEACYFDAGRWHYANDGDGPSDRQGPPTHWMPLPDPPKGER